LALVKVVALASAVNFALALAWVHMSDSLLESLARVTEVRYWCVTAWNKHLLLRDALKIRVVW